MSVVVETLNPLERKITISIPAETIDTEIAKRLQKLKQTAKLDGFRPGKIPLNVLQQRFGQEVTFETIDKVIQQSYQDALHQHELKPAGIPEIKIEEAYQPGKPLCYTATIEIFPVIDLLSHSDLIIEKVVATLTDDDLEKTLEGMRKQRTTWQVVERPAKEGDRLSLAFVGTIDGKPFEGGKSDNMPLVLGSHSTIAGFEEGLLDAITNQNITLSLVFPENYGVKTLASKPVQFDITVLKIEEPVLPELNEEFAGHFGIKEGGLEKLKEEVSETLARQLTRQLQQKLKSEVMAKLADAYRGVDVPKALIQREAQHLFKQAEQQFSQYASQKTFTLTPEMFTERAKERVILGLVVNEIIKQEQLTPNPEKVRVLIENIAEQYDNPEQIIKWYYQQKERLSEIEGLALEDEIVDKIMAVATIVEKPATAQEVLSMGGGR